MERQFPHSFRRTARISLNFQTRFCSIKIDHFFEIYHFIYIFFLLFEFQTQPMFLMFHLSTFFTSILKYSPSSITITMLNDFILGTRTLNFFIGAPCLFLSNQNVQNFKITMKKHDYWLIIQWEPYFLRGQTQ